MVKVLKKAPLSFAAQLPCNQLSDHARPLSPPRTCRQDQARLLLPVRLLTFASSSARSSHFAFSLTSQHARVYFNNRVYLLLLSSLTNIYREWLGSPETKRLNLSPDCYTRRLGKNLLSTIEN